MIYKLIYWLFKKQLLKIYYSEQSKKKGFENMTPTFVDSNGKRYFVPVNDFDIPILRTKAIETAILAISRGLSQDELKKFIEAMKKAVGEGKKPDVAMIGHLIIEMEKREDMLLHPDLMFDLVAYRYIREDEDPAVIDKEIHAQKVEQFKKDSIEGLYDFFYAAGVSQYIPYLTKSESEWNELWQDRTAKIKAMNKHLELCITEAK
jgi:hypothetical protein